MFRLSLSSLVATHNSNPRFFDWLSIPRYSSEQAAAIGTAEATWALFWITCAAALVTFLAVLVALFGPLIVRYLQSKDEEKSRSRRRVATDGEIQQAILLMKEIEAHFRLGQAGNQIELWTFLNKSNVSRRLMEYRLTTDLGDEAYPPRILQTLQSQYEVRDACQGLLDVVNKNAGPDAALKVGLTICERALERCCAIAEIRKPNSKWDFFRSRRLTAFFSPLP